LTIAAAITLAIALVGAVLGLINTWQNFDRDRVKLRVSVNLAYLITTQGVSSTPQIAIEVINRSQFPLTISQLGLEQSGTKNVLALISPIMIDGGRLPRRIEPRDAFTAYFSAEATHQVIHSTARRGYAKTASGEIAHSSSRAMRNVLRQLRGE
jgi:hypothetical protein